MSDNEDLSKFQKTMIGLGLLCVLAILLLEAFGHE